MPNDAEKKYTIIKYAARCALIILALVVTPFLAKPVAKLFDWAMLSWSKSGELRVFFTELFTAIFWLVEWLGFVFLDKRLTKKFLPDGAQPMKRAEETRKTEIDTSEAEKEVAASEIKKKSLPQTPLLPMKNVGILFAIVAACILLISAQIGFEVKPFYELGEKMTYSEMVNKIGEIIRNAVKCMLIVAFLKSALALGEEVIVGQTLSARQKTWRQWLLVGTLLLVFGVCDVLLTANPFAWTYLVFYIAFTAIYFFTQKAIVKSYLLIFFIYIF